MSGLDLDGQLVRAEARLSRLEAEREAIELREANRHWTELDTAVGSGVRRKPNRKADERRFNHDMKEANVYRAIPDAVSAVDIVKARIAERDRVRLTRDDIVDARAVFMGGRWWRVVRVNQTTVSVDSGYSWVDRYTFDKITRVAK